MSSSSSSSEVSEVASLEFLDDFVLLFDFPRPLDLGVEHREVLDSLSGDFFLSSSSFDKNCLTLSKTSFCKTEYLEKYIFEEKKNTKVPVVQKKKLSKFSLDQFVLKLFYPETKSFMLITGPCKTLQKFPNFVKL